jgi:hypothetical protein
MTKTTSSLILEDPQGTGTSSYLNLEYLRKRAGGSLKFKEPFNNAIFISSHLVVDSSIVKQWTI